MNIGHMSLQTIHTEELFVTIIASMSVDGWLTKEVKEEKNIEEFDKDSMKVGVQSRERHNLSMDILFRKSQAQTKVKMY